MKDLFGDAPEQSQPTTRGRGPKGGKHYVQPKGYAAMPGTGPTDETCGSCKFAVRGRRWLKCELIRARWTHGRGTDILARTPACSKWQEYEAVCATTTPPKPESSDAAT